jgi:hypothetical protein
MSVIKCGKCGAVLSSPDPATCPQCGRALSEIHLLVDEEISLTLREKLHAKVRYGQPGEIAPHLETTAGDDLQRSSGRWLHLERRVDREKDLYTEKLTDPETGEVMRDVRERLSEHRGRGAAKSGGILRDSQQRGESRLLPPPR